MADFRLMIVDGHFSDTVDLRAKDEADAWREAIRSAIVIAADQVADGNPFFGAEVRLEKGGTVIGRYVVSVVASRLSE